MIREGKIKKVDFKKLSDKKCKVCGRPLKENSEKKGHTMCYVCFKISKGKKTVNEHRLIDGRKILVKKIDLIKLQAANIKLYKN